MVWWFAQLACDQEVLGLIPTSPNLFSVSVRAAKELNWPKRVKQVNKIILEYSN